MTEADGPWPPSSARPPSRRCRAAASRSARPTTQPPKPAPVSRAPRAPAPRSASTSASSSGVETSKSSRRLWWLAFRSGPSAATSPASTARAASSTRAFSETTWRANGSSATCSGVASRRDANPSCAATASQARRRSAYALSTSVRDVPEWMISAASRAGSGIGVTSSERQSIRRAWSRLAGEGRQLVHDPARHAGGLLLGFPAGEGQLAPRELEPRRVAERERECDLERCARGEAGAERDRSTRSTAWIPTAGRPRAASAATTPAAYRLQTSSPAGAVEPSAASSTSPPTVERPAAGGARRPVGSRARCSRARSPQAAQSPRCSRCGRRSGSRAPARCTTTRAQAS